jgi:hypothetical protein
MKRLSVLVCIFVATLTFFGTQIQPTKAATPKEELLATGQKVFTDFITEEQNKIADPRKNKSGFGGASDAQVAAFKTGAENLIKYVGQAGETFTQLMNSPATGTNSSDSAVLLGVYRAALLKAKEDINSLTKADRTITGVVGLPAEVNTIQTKLQQAIDAPIDTLNWEGKGDQSVAIANATAAERKQQAENELKNRCSLFNIEGCVSTVVRWLIKNTLLQIAGFLVWLTANMFNYAIQMGILDFKSWAPDTLYPIWIIVRQIISLIIVFVGLYLGFMYIIGREDRFQKYIPWVIIFGLFVNFSYPLTRTLIDISNMVSLNVYSSAVGNDALTANFTSRNTAGALIMNRLGLQGLIGSAVSEQTTSNFLSSTNSIPGSLIAVVFVFYAAYVFFVATAIIIMRTVSLVFITIVSPLLLVDSVLPLLGERAKQMRKIFFDQLIVGPVFMILLALTLKFLSVFSMQNNLGSMAVAAGDGKTVKEFFNILMMLIMLHFTLKATKSISGSIGQYATDALGKVGGFGLGVASGGAGLLARGSIGRLATKARDSSWVKNNQDSFIGRRAYDLSNSVAKSSFDLRNSSVVAKGAGMAGLSGGLMGVGMGSGTKTTFEEESNKRMARINARQERIKTRYERDVYKKDEKGNVVLDEKGMPVIEHKKGDLDQAGVEAKERYQANYGGSMFITSKQRAEMDDKAAEERSKNLMEEYKKLPKNQRAKKITELRAALERQMQTDKKMETTESRALAKTLQDLRNDKSEVDENVQSVFDEYKDMSRTEKVGKYNEIADEVGKHEEGSEWFETAEGQKLSRLKKMMETEQKEFKKKVEEATSTYQTLKDEKAKNEFLAKNLTKEVREQVMKDLHLTPTGDLLDKSGVSAQMAKGMEEVAKRASGEQNNTPSMSSQMAQGMEAAGRRMAEQQAQASQTTERSSPSFSMTSGPGVSFVDHLKKTRHITQQPEPATPDQNTPQVTTNVGGAYSAQGTVTPTKITFSSQMSSEQQARVLNSVQTAGVRAEPHTATDTVAPSATTKPAANKDSVNTIEDESAAAMV